jgi:homoserine dehydrogenase
MSQDLTIGISFFGAGNIGTTVISEIDRLRVDSFGLSDVSIEIRHILVRSLDRAAREAQGFVISEGQITTDVEEILSDQHTHIVVELMGGEDPAGEYIRRALEAGKHVITANKAVIAASGASLFEIANRNDLHLQFEASVGGGIPIISSLRRDLVANNISSIEAIINGTTNFILSKMSTGDDYESALAEAGRLGYAEPDPSADVDGHDAVAKSIILAMLAFGALIPKDRVVSQGIRGIVSADMQAALELGYTIKLLARIQSTNGQVSASVLPTLVGRTTQLGNVGGVTNAVEYKGDLVGTLFYEGPGAGREATTSAVLADLIEVIRDETVGRKPLPFILPESLPIRIPTDLSSRFFLRLIVVNTSGVLAEISKILAVAGISIASVVQKDIGTNNENSESLPESAELILTTHVSNRGQIEQAIEEFDGSEAVLQIGSVLPISG